nr:MAG TPA: hypothetical protein [Caudoviricetes sp.]
MSSPYDHLECLLMGYAYPYVNLQSLPSVHRPIVTTRRPDSKTIQLIRLTIEE